MKKAESPLLKNKHYDVLKWISLIVIPSFGTLYFALSTIWGFPNGEQVVGTAVAIETFLGLLLGYSSSNYEPDTDGQLNITTSGEKDIYSLDVDTPLDEIKDKDHVVFVMNRL